MILFGSALSAQHGLLCVLMVIPSALALLQPQCCSTGPDRGVRHCPWDSHALPVVSATKGNLQEAPVA